MELMDYLSAAQHSIFRFEYLQDFSATDKDAFTQWQNHELDITQAGKGWWEDLDTLHKRGVVTQRVRRVVRPMNDYTKFEIEIHKESAKRGDKIRIIGDDLFQTLDITLQDFWLVDNKIAIKMNYGDQGRYLGFSIDEDIEKYAKAKDLLWRHSFPIEENLIAKI